MPLTDATADNGCPICVPGLHRKGTLKHWSTPIGFQCLEDPEDAVTTPAKVGDVVVFSSLTPHQTGPNTTDAVRKAYIVQFAPDGAYALRGEPGKGEPKREPQDAANRQFLVLKGGENACVGAVGQSGFRLASASKERPIPIPEHRVELKLRRYFPRP